MTFLRYCQIRAALSASLPPTSEQRQEALDAARPVAEEAHCRYCDNARTEPVRLKCASDIADSAAEIADLLLSEDRRKDNAVISELLDEVSRLHHELIRTGEERNKLNVSNLDVEISVLKK